jgi:stage II sporulation protein D
MGRPMRVGIFYSISSKDTRVFSAGNKSATGFEIGISGGTSFSKLFELGINEFVIAPSGNLYIKSSAGLLYSGTGGAYTFGGFHVQLSGSYGSFAAASEAASHSGAFVAYYGSNFVVRVGSYTSLAEAEAACAQYSGSTAVSAAGLTLCDTAGQKILFEFESEKRFAIRARGGSTVTVSASSGSYPYYGFFEYDVEGKKLSLVNVVDLEQYVKGVLPYEVGLSASDEVTKAFSILARTFACGRKHSGSNIDVCSSTCCQVYRGAQRETERINKIVDSTKGQIITYNGGLAKCFYNVSNGGASCSSAAAWGSTPIPYLNSVQLDEGEATVVWNHTFTKAELFSYLKQLPAFSSLKGGITSVQILEKDPLGSDYVTAFAATDNYGNTVTVRNSAAVKSSLGFASSNFTIKYTFNRTVKNASGETSTASNVITANGTKEIQFGDTQTVIGADGKVSTVTADRITFDGKGKGHGVGYSQIGAEQLVKQGFNYAYTIAFYFPGTELSKISS